MKFKNIEEAKNSLVEAILTEYIATLIDDDKLQEKSIKKAYKVEDYIKNNYDVKNIKNLLNHDVPKVQIWAAAKMLLPIYEEIALKVLNDIREKEIPHCSHNAGMIADYWKK